MPKVNFSALALALFVSTVSVPQGVLAACSLSALDTVAGLGTQVSLTGCNQSTSGNISVVGPSGNAYTQTIATDSLGSATTLIPSKVTVTAGTYAITGFSTRGTFDVIADRADDTHSSIAASPRTVRSGGQDIVTVTTILRDRYDNPVTGRPIALVSSRTSDDIDPQSTETDDQGRFLWTIRPQEAGIMTLSAVDIVSGRQMKLSTSVTVGSVSTPPSWYRGSLTGDELGGDVTGDISSATIDGFELELPQTVTQVKANELFSMTVRAMRGSTVVRSYIGTLIVESSDPDAELPKKGEDPKSPDTGRIDIRNVDQGERKVPLSFVLRRKGIQTISVYDKLDPSIKGEISINVIRSDGVSNDELVILDPKDRSAIKGETVLLQGRAPSLINLRVKGGKELVDGESDSEGVFRISVPLHAADKEVTLFVESENGTYESAPVHLIIDNDPPSISTVETVPAEGRTDEPATVTVSTEPKLTSVTVSLKGKESALTESGTGLYVGEIIAPHEDGIYDLTVQAKDSVNNETTLIAKWTVKPRTVPVVQGVKAEGGAGQVTVSWKAIQTIPITEYKIYIAKQKEPKNYLYSIGTQEPVTSAVVKDLALGEVYLFLLTAVSDEGKESPEKSSPASASPLGIVLKAKPSQDSVLLEWTPMPNLPLSHYALEFGTDPGVYPEKRSVNGQASSTIVRDLIRDVSYEFKLTPIAVTGKALPEYAATVRGTPGGSTFIAGTTDPAPDGMFDALHKGADLKKLTQPGKLRELPSTTGSGISSIVGALAILTSIVLGLLFLKHQREQKLMREFMASMQEKYHS